MKYLFSRLANRAVSLTEVLVAMGMVGGLSLGYLQISSDHDKSQKKIEAGFEIDMLIMDMTQVLSNERACANTLGSDLAEGRDIAVIKNSAGQVVFQKGKKYGQNLIQIKSMKMANLDTTGDGFGNVEVLVTFEKTTKSRLGKREEVRSIPLPIRAAPDRVVCYPTDGSMLVAQSDIKMMCDSLGGTFKNISGHGVKCVMPFVNKFCPEYVIGFTEDGQLDCGTFSP